LPIAVPCKLHDQASSSRILNAQSVPLINILTTV
jgi:hypothetical protein